VSKKFKVTVCMLLVTVLSFSMLSPAFASADNTPNREEHELIAEIEKQIAYIIEQAETLNRNMDLLGDGIDDVTLIAFEERIEALDKALAIIEDMGRAFGSGLLGELGAHAARELVHMAKAKLIAGKATVALAGAGVGTITTTAVTATQTSTTAVKAGTAVAKTGKVAGAAKAGLKGLKLGPVGFILGVGAYLILTD
jgi:hypothetical protein